LFNFFSGNGLINIGDLFRSDGTYLKESKIEFLLILGLPFSPAKIFGVENPYKTISGNVLMQMQVDFNYQECQIYIKGGT